MKSSNPSKFSIALAHGSAIGHVNTGLGLYRGLAQESDSFQNKGEEIAFGLVLQKGVPAVTNLALGLELLLKVHHFQISGNYPRGHDICDLGGSFPETSLTIIRANYKSMYEDPTIDKGIIVRLKGGINGGTTVDWPLEKISTYDAAIAHIGPMYVQWRYIYEEFLESIDVRISYAPLYFSAMSVNRAIGSFEGKTKITIGGGNYDT